MIKEKYTQLLLSYEIGGITTIGDTHKLCGIRKNLLVNLKHKAKYWWENKLVEFPSILNLQENDIGQHHYFLL